MTLMKKIGCLIGVLCSMLSLQAQDMKSLFVALPDSLSPLLTKVNREDFGDFLASNMKAQVKNRFGKTSEMLTLTDDYLWLKQTSASTVAMKLLPVNDSVRVVCVVQTYEGPAADSKVAFYDTGWKQLDASDYLTLPAEDEFYEVPSSEAQKDSLANARAFADMYLLKAELDEKTAGIRFTYTTPDYLDKETAGKLRPFLRKEPVELVWKEGKFQK